MLFNETGDITARKHGGAEASRRANQRVNKGTDNAAVLAVFKRRFQTTSKEVAAELDKPLNAISGRFTWLKKHGYIAGTGRIAGDGCELLVVTEKGLKA